MQWRFKVPMDQSAKWQEEISYMLAIVLHCSLFSLRKFLLSIDYEGSSFSAYPTLYLSSEP